MLVQRRRQAGEANRAGGKGGKSLVVLLDIPDRAGGKGILQALDGVQRIQGIDGQRAGRLVLGGRGARGLLCSYTHGISILSLCSTAAGRLASGYIVVLVVGGWRSQGKRFMLGGDRARVSSFTHPAPPWRGCKCHF